MDELVGLPRRAAATARARAPSCSQRADLVFTGGHSLYEAKRGAPPATSTPSRAASTSPTSARRARAPAGAGRPGRHPAPAHRLLRRDRRAAGHRPAGGRRRRAAGLAARPARAGGEDRPRRACRGGPTSTTSGSKSYDELPAYLVGLGRGVHAVRAERGDPLHQPDQDAGVPGGRQAGRLDADRATSSATYGERGLVRIAATPGEFVAGARGLPGASAGDRPGWLAAVDRPARDDVVGPDLGRRWRS